MTSRNRSTRTAPATTDAPAPEQEQTPTPATDATEQATAPAPATSQTPIAPAAAPTEQQLADALAKLRAEHPERAAKVLRVTMLGSKGQAIRVVVGCAEPQTKHDGTSVCRGERDIATQDLFQVRLCTGCQDRKLKLARRARTKARLAKAKAALRAAEAGAEQDAE